MEALSLPTAVDVESSPAGRGVIEACSSDDPVLVTEVVANPRRDQDTCVENLDMALSDAQAQLDMLLKQKDELESDMQRWSADQIRLFEDIERLRHLEAEGVDITTRIQHLHSNALSLEALKVQFENRKILLESQLEAAVNAFEAEKASFGNGLEPG